MSDSRRLKEHMEGWSAMRDNPMTDERIKRIKRHWKRINEYLGQKGMLEELIEWLDYEQMERIIEAVDKDHDLGLMEGREE